MDVRTWKNCRYAVAGASKFDFRTWAILSWIRSWFIWIRHYWPVFRFRCQQIWIYCRWERPKCRSRFWNCSSSIFFSLHFCNWLQNCGYAVLEQNFFRKLWRIAEKIVTADMFLQNNISSPSCRLLGKIAVAYVRYAVAEQHFYLKLLENAVAEVLPSSCRIATCACLPLTSWKILWALFG